MSQFCAINRLLFSICLLARNGFGRKVFLLKQTASRRRAFSGKENSDYAN
jgi:hypothetical protein